MEGFGALPGNVIVVENLPKVNFERLEGGVRGIFNQIGVINENGVCIPVDEDDNGRIKGYCFVEYNTRQEAELAKEKANGYRVTRAHVFAVSLFDDITVLLGEEQDPERREVSVNKWGMWVNDWERYHQEAVAEGQGN